MTISRSIILRIRNVSDKSCRENQTLRFMLINFICKSFRLWNNVENILEPDKPQMTMWRMRVVHRIPKAINTFIKLRNNYRFSNTTVTARPRPTVAFERTWAILFIDRIIDLRRRGWEGHVARMLVGNTEWYGNVGRPSCGLKENIGVERKKIVLSVSD